MNCVKMVFASSSQTLKKWMRNYRIWMICILVVIFVNEYLRGIYDLAKASEYAVTPWVFPFIDSQIYIRILIYMGVIILFCDAPFMDRNQMYVIARCGRMKYAAGQLIAVVMMTMVYFFILMIAPVLLNLKYTGFSMDWGVLLNSASRTNVLEGFTKTYLIIYSVVIKNLTPVQAMVMAYIYHTLTGVLLGSVIYFANICFKKGKGIGVVCAGALVAADPFFSMFDNLYKLSPVSWGRMDLINYQANTKRFTPVMAGMMLLGLILIMSIMCILKSRKWEIKSSVADE